LNIRSNLENRTCYARPLRFLVRVPHQNRTASRQNLSVWLAIQPDYLPARGGLRVGDILSRIYQQPLAILAASSYGSDRIRSSLIFSQNLTMTTPQLGSHILLVDDLVDSGKTLEQTVIWLKQHYQAQVQEVRTAVIWYKACSMIAPDYYADYLPDNPWIHQPFEGYEQMNPAELAERYQQLAIHS
jgi:uncharacterized protein